MAFNVLDIINTNAIKVKSVTIDGPFNYVDTNLNNTFLEAVRNATTDLSNIDCGDNILNNTINKVGDFVSDNLKFKKIVKYSTELGNFGKVEDKFIDLICFNINQYLKELELLLDGLLKIPLEILKKIQKLKDKLEQALLDFSKKLRDCFIKIILDAKKSLNKLYKETIGFDGLLELMQQCPCIMELIQDLFTKCKNVRTPQEVINCLNTEYKFSPATILNKVNDWIDKNVGNTIFFFNLIDDAIQLLLETLILPLRELIKKYCKLLNEKHNLNYLLGKNQAIRCLFEYSLEFDKNGNKYYGMSIIDMLNSMKKWSSCIDFVCSSLHDDIKRDIQSYNDQLKLDFKYWNDEISVDIYFACIASNLDSSKIRPSAVREIFMKGNGKGIFTSVLDYHKSVGKYVQATKIEQKEELGDVVKNILSKDDPDESGILAIDGQELFKPGIENLIIEIYKNLGIEIKNNYYYNKVIELGEWDYKFKKSEDYIKTKERLQSVFQSPNQIINAYNFSNTSQNLSIRVIDEESYKSPVLPTLNTYETPKNYVEYDFGNPPVKNNGESMKNYLLRWYNQI